MPILRPALRAGLCAALLAALPLAAAPEPADAADRQRAGGVILAGHDGWRRDDWRGSHGWRNGAARHLERRAHRLERRADRLERRSDVLQRRSDILERRADRLDRLGGPYARRADRLERRSDVLDHRARRLDRRADRLEDRARFLERRADRVGRWHHRRFDGGWHRDGRSWRHRQHLRYPPVRVERRVHVHRHDHDHDALPYVLGGVLATAILIDILDDR